MRLAVGICEELFVILAGAPPRLVDLFLEQCEELFRELNDKQDVAFFIFGVSVSFIVPSSAYNNQTRNASRS
jgi:hypothetical protein